MKKQLECTANPTMIEFWSIAKEDWLRMAQNFRTRKDHAMADMYEDLADKAMAQMAYISSKLGAFGDKDMRVGTHGNIMNISSRVLKTPNGNVQL